MYAKQHFRFEFFFGTEPIHFKCTRQPNLQIVFFTKTLKNCDTWLADRNHWSEKRESQNRRERQKASERKNGTSLVSIVRISTGCFSKLTILQLKSILHRPDWQKLLCGCALDLVSFANIFVAVSPSHLASSPAKNAGPCFVCAHISSIERNWNSSYTITAMTAFQRIFEEWIDLHFFSLDGIVTEYEKWVLEMRRVWCNKQPKRNGWWFFEIVSQITFRSARVWARKLAIVRECVRVISCYRVSLLSLFQFVVHKIQVSESQTAGYVQKREIGSVYKSSMQAFQPKMSLNFNGKRASTVFYISAMLKHSLRMLGSHAETPTSIDEQWGVTEIR